MIRGASFRGQPLLLLAGIVFGWAGLRAALWEHAPAVEYFPSVNAASDVRSHAAIKVSPEGSRQGKSLSAPAPERAAPKPEQNWSQPVPAPLPEKPLWEPLAAGVSGASSGSGPTSATPPAGSAAAGKEQSARTVIGHELLLVAGLSQMEIPEELLPYFSAEARQKTGHAQSGPIQSGYVPPGYVQSAGPQMSLAPASPQAGAPALVEAGAANQSHWSGDGWLFLRRDGVSNLTPGQAFYGRSQAGAVVRYQLAPGAQRPQVYVRGSAALTGSREEEVAAGLSVRPVASLPIRVAVEGRYTQRSAGDEVRPAAYAVTEFAPVRLPLNMRGEAYVQGGYVGGDFDTAFVDGQARIDKPLITDQRTELSAGLAAWGGAQRDASRLDVGPTAQVSFGLGSARGRIAADYRFRIAGDAEPKSGPALTLSAGF